jgi:hypothetical protein
MCDVPPVTRITLPSRLEMSVAGLKDLLIVAIQSLKIRSWEAKMMNAAMVPNY